MKKFYISLIFSLITIGLLAQQLPISHININNVNATILGNGSCYVPQQWDGETQQCTTWEVPFGSGNETIHQHSLWFGGLDSSDNLHLAALRYGQNGQDYWMGPLKNPDASSDLMTLLKFHRVWSVTRSDINQFIAHHDESGYNVPDDILSWPAYDDESAETLAPFVDVNGDGHYNPADGDYPDIRGDQCLFFVFNDNYAEHEETGGERVGLEVHAMVYAFNSPDDDALNNTVFVNYKFFNRSANDYHNVFIGLWNDWNIGHSDDDFVGCDVQRNSCYAYNGYSDNPPVQVCTILSSPDELGMSRFVCHENTDSDMGNPRNAQEYYNLLQGIWRDGNMILYGGNGHPSDPNAVGPACHYMFPGDSDPDNIGTGGVEPNGGYNTNGVYWTEEHEGDTPGNRIGLASVGPFDFTAGSMKELDYAMITAWNGNGQTAMERTNAYIDHIRVFFDGYINKTIKFVKNGTDLMIRSRLSADNDIVVTMYVRNGNLTFKDLYVGDKSLNDAQLVSEEYLIRNIGDMVGPVSVSTFGPLYAQHEWRIPRMVSVLHNLDDSDIGSLWEDNNGYRFTIGRIEGFYIDLFPEITMDENGLYSSSWRDGLAYPSSLSHVSGAVHTAPISGSSDIFYLRSQIGADKHYILDGTEITDDGEYYCNQLQIQEHILGLNIGRVENWFPIPEYNGSLVDFDRIFEFNYGMNVTCNTTMYCKYPFKLTNYRSLQPQFPLQYNQYHSYTFIPKIKKLQNSQRIDMPFDSDDGTSSQINVNRTTQHLYDIDKQPERCIAYLENDEGQYLVGMASGGSLTRGISTDSIRNSYVNVGNNTARYGGGTGIENKFYPAIINQYTFDTPIDTSFVAEVSGYYTWFDPNINDCKVHFYKDEDNYIVYIHAFESMPKARINLPTFMEGMVIDSIIEKTQGTTMLTQQVVGGKLYASFDTDENLANYIVLKMKSTWN